MKTKLPSVALAAILFAGLPLASSSAYVGISVAIAPPAIPVYTQPYCPAPGYIWTPGYWAYGAFGYYWVPGAWVLPPGIGLFWTPGYWGYNGGRYVFNQGYWGPTVGFYGGINYGYGYGGRGYYGGEWAGNTFRYNTAVTRVNPTVIHNTYVNREVVNRNTTGSRTSFNGPGGVQAKPTQREQAAAKSRRIPPTATQRSRVEAAKKDPALRVANNKGKPNADAVKTFDNKHRPKASETAAGTKPQRGDRQTAERNSAATKNRSGATNSNRNAAQKNNGNSAFGHRQGDATTRTKGSQNNAYGKAQSAGAPAARSPKKTNPAQKTSASQVRSSRRASQTGEIRKTTGVPHAAKNTKAVPGRSPQAVSAKRKAPAARGPGPAPTQQNSKKKKKGAKKGPGDDR